MAVLRSKVLHGVLWVGLGLCVLAVWKGAAALDVELASVGWQRWLVFSGGLIVGLALAITAWRESTRAFLDVGVTWAAAARQTGLLLIGKYLPGGVFGFIARMGDDATTSRSQRLGAGLAEQGMSIVAVLWTGLALYALSMGGAAWPALLLLLGLLPVALYLATRGSLAFLGSAQGLGRWRQIPLPAVRSRVALMKAGIFIAAQAILWALLVALLSRWLYGVDWADAITLAGAFGLAVGIGMLALIAPGGIGVREGALVALASPVLPPAEALVLAASLRLASAGVDIVAGLLAVIVNKSAHDAAGVNASDGIPGRHRGEPQ